MKTWQYQHWCVCVCALNGASNHATQKQSLLPILKPTPYELGRSFQLSCAGQSVSIFDSATDVQETLPMQTQDIEAAAAAAAVAASPPAAKGATCDDAALRSDSPKTKRAKYQHRVGHETTDDSLGNGAQPVVPRDEPTSHVPTNHGGDEAKVPDPTPFSHPEPEGAGAKPPKVLQTCFRNVAFYLDLFRSWSQ